MNTNYAEKNEYSPCDDCIEAEGGEITMKCSGNMGKRLKSCLDYHPIEKVGVVCANCGNNNVDTSMEEYKFPYGIGIDRVELLAMIPVRKCKDCGFKYSDCVADKIIHEAVCNHLGVMTSAQIQNLREKYDFTREEFAEFTGITEGTLQLWEDGIRIQDKASNNFLYLLSFEDNFQRLIDRREK